MIRFRFVAFVVLAVWMGAGFLCASEPPKGAWQASLEISTKHVWRGLEFGTSPVLFPALTYTREGFSAYAMGGYATNGSHQEVDFGASYTFKNWTLGLNDYYYPTQVGDADNYFDFSNSKSRHWGEVYVTYTGSKIPFWATLTTFVYGTDKLDNGNNAYSTYLELGYTQRITDESNLTLIGGLSPNRGFYTGYQSTLAWPTLTLKYSQDIKIGSYTLPVSASWLFNPHIKKSFFSCSIIFKTP